MDIVLLCRNEKIAESVERCARKQITLEECCKQIAAMGFTTTSVYQMVRAVEDEINRTEPQYPEGQSCATSAVDHDLSM